MEENRIKELKVRSSRKGHRYKKGRWRTANLNSARKKVKVQKLQWWGCGMGSVLILLCIFTINPSDFILLFNLEKLKMMADKAWKEHILIKKKKQSHAECKTHAKCITASFFLIYTNTYISVYIESACCIDICSSWYF